VPRDGFDMRRAADDRDVRPGAGEHGAEIAADGAAAHHRDFRPAFVAHPE
jgi:hypothetical protein